MKSVAVEWLSLICLFIRMTGSGARSPSCSWSHKQRHSHKDRTLTSVVCHWAELRADKPILLPSNGNYFTDQVSSLRVTCRDDSANFSNLGKVSFEGTRMLKNLDVRACKFRTFPLLSMAQLSNLRGLSVDGGMRFEHTNYTLNLSSTLFSSLKQIRHLKLTNLNILQIRRDALCSVQHLHSLNISSNVLTDCHFGLTKCSSALHHLDLSHNKLTQLKMSCFSTMSHLHTLHLDNNKLSSIDGEWSRGLKRLTFLSLANNRIGELNEKSFSKTPHLTTLDISGNDLVHLPPYFFTSFKYLKSLNISGNRIQDVRRLRLVGGIRLSLLDLSNNRIARLPYLDDLVSLQTLNLSQNRITHLTGALLAPLTNLALLDVSYNSLAQVTALSLPGLLQLNLEHNQLSTLYPEDLRECQQLKQLILHHNRFTEIPTSAVINLKHIKHLDLSANHLQQVEFLTQNSNSKIEISSLENVALSGNTIRHLQSTHLVPVRSVRRLYLNDNLISSIEAETFRQLTSLRELNLGANRLGHIGQLFMTVSSLRVLDLSGNKIVHFDLAMIPRELLQLNLANNNISIVGNYFSVEDSMRLQSLNIAGNRLAKLQANNIPNSLQKLILRKNNINSVSTDAFINKNNLHYVDLGENVIESISEFSLKNRTVNLSDNPLLCSCGMDWLLDNMVHIENKTSLQCQLPFGVGQGSPMKITSLRRHQFLCQYRTHCFALCHCCDFDACDCEMECPQNCTCYHDILWSTNIVDCSSRNFSQLPTMIPMDVTEVHLDGNQMPTLGSHQLIGRKNMQALYLNNSHIRSVDNKTFNGLSGLVYLHLEYNDINALVGYEFDDLVRLKELHLQFNKIAHIDEMTFKPLKNLRELALHGNRLISVAQWPFVENRRLTQLTLSDNPWNCECHFAETLAKWILSSGVKLYDQNEIKCTSTGQTQRLILNIDRNCSLQTKVALSSVMRRTLFSYTTLLVAAVSAFLMMLSSVFVFIWRRRKSRSLSIFSRSSSSSCPDGGKLYDIMISCSADDAALAAELCHELETGWPRHRCCLPGRDLCVEFDVGVISKVAASCRQYLLLVTSAWLQQEWKQEDVRRFFSAKRFRGRRRLILVWCRQAANDHVDAEMKDLEKIAYSIQLYNSSAWSDLRSHLIRKNNSLKCFAIKRNSNKYSTDSQLLYENHKTKKHIICEENSFPSESNASTLPCPNILVPHGSHHIYYTIDMKDNSISYGSSRKSSDSRNQQRHPLQSPVLYQGMRLHSPELTRSTRNTSPDTDSHAVLTGDRMIRYSEAPDAAEVSNHAGWFFSNAGKYNSKTSKQKGTYFV